MSEALAIDRAALRNDIKRNADFGMVDTDSGVGRTVLPGTTANGQARSHLVDRMVTAGLDVSVDAVGNIIGRWAPQNCDDTARPVAAGSHLDSVPMGGIFDGPLGVYSALEAVRTIQRSTLAVDRPIEVVCFTGEEGTRFADGVLGSSVAAGKRSVEDALALTDGETTLKAALEDIGFQGEGRVDASDWDAWFEVHPEQSDVLEEAGLPVGIVTSITGTTRCHVDIKGKADHAGTTAMHERTDALAAASEFVLTVEDEANEIAAHDSKSAVATVGSLTVEPGTINVVPGSVKLSVDIRDIDASFIDRLVDTVEATCETLRHERGVGVSLDIPYSIEPRPMSPCLRKKLREAVEDLGFDAFSLHSGAGHDTMHIADVTDAGLLFARSRGGYSHSPLEETDWHDCAVATQTLATALARVAGADLSSL